MRAGQFNSVVTLPDFETTTNLLMFDLRQTIAVGNAALDRIGALKPREVTFENTVRALDDIGYQISLTDDRFGLIKETSTNAALRDTATDALKQLEEWTVGMDYREDVYKALKAYADTEAQAEGRGRQAAGRDHARLPAGRPGPAQGPARRGGAHAQGADAADDRLRVQHHEGAEGREVHQGRTGGGAGGFPGAGQEHQ